MQTPKPITNPVGVPPPAALQLELSGALDSVQPAAQAVRRFLQDHGCTEQELIDCELALVEACTNAIQYAAPDGRHLPVKVEVLCLPQEIELRVTDHSAGFTWPQSASLPEPESESGRGIYLIQTLMDETHYLPQPEGNLLLLRKRRSGS